MDGTFTEKAQQALEVAQHTASHMGNKLVGTEHLLFGLAKIEDSIAASVLSEQRINSYIIERQIIAISNTPVLSSAEAAVTEGFTPRTRRILEMSQQEFLRTKSKSIGTEHILLAILRETDSFAHFILSGLGLDFPRAFADILVTLGEGQPQNLPNQAQQQAASKASQTPNLDRFSRDLTALARSKTQDPVIGRTKETERVIQILTRRTKNNPCLIGDPGVGKTAIAEGLAQRIAAGNVPEPISNKRVVSLDIAAMVAGTKYRGEFEERIKRVIQEVTSTSNIILFIDEIHTLIGAGGAEGSLDAANILKPALARGEMQVVGATTLSEYRKHVEKDAALERRFQPVMVDEPSEEEAIAILMGIKDKYEQHHNVEITADAVDAAVMLSTRYIYDRFLPDKAIDLLDETASRVRLRSHAMPPNLKILTDKIENLDDEKDAAIKEEDFEKVGMLKQRQKLLREQLIAEEQHWRDAHTRSHHVVDADEIAAVLASNTGLPVTRLQQEESQRLIEMEATIHKRVIGQDQAVSTISKAIRRGRVGLKNPNRPIGSFLFLGPTGVGKTYLCRSLAEILFGDEDAIIRVDMSEFMEKHNASRLVGSPPGYVGFEEGGELSEKVRRKPYSVILFDEIEKAHPDIFNILLQVLDDGHITDAQGRKINFKNTVIIMTSNVGARAIINPKKLGFLRDNSSANTYDDMKKKVMEEVKELFRPEFLNRIDDIVVFHPLENDDIKEITAIMLGETSSRIAENMGITLTFTSELVDYIASDGYDQMYGARPLRRAIQSKVEDVLADAILQGKFVEGMDVCCNFDGAGVTFSIIS